MSRLGGVDDEGKYFLLISSFCCCQAVWVEVHKGKREVRCWGKPGATPMRFDNPCEA